MLVYKYSQLGQGTLFSASLALSMVFDTKGFACAVSFNPTSPIIILLYPFYRQWLPRWLSGERIYLQCRRRRRHRRPELDAWIRKIPWRRKWHPTPVFLPEKSHGQRSPAGYSPRGHSKSDMTEQLSSAQHVFVWLIVFYALFEYHRNVTQEDVTPGLSMCLLCALF